MGIVYSAYDPQLDRRVALKVLRADLDEDSNGSARLLSEGQALARLAHPNVVEIYDVGVREDDVFIAMELVDGQTMNAWLKVERHFTEVLAILLGAGQGLAAAHAAGLVHRDFKPGNVLVGPGSRVRVVDFGLATPTEAWEPWSSVSDPGLGSDSNTIAGTPRYMAPEQALGGTIDARSDQFSFCVTLYRALYGVFPFESSRGEPRDLELRRPRVPPRGGAVPRYLWPLIERGLAYDPDQRHPSMDALLRAIDPRRRRSLVAWGMGATAIAGGLGWMLSLSPAPPADPCEIGALRVVDAWGPSTRPHVRAAIIAADEIQGQQIAERVERHVDGYAQTWANSYGEVCSSLASVAQELQLACLDDRLAIFAATLEILAAADGEVAAHALETVHRMESVDSCADTRALTQTVAPPEPAISGQVSALREHLHLAKALGLAGKYEDEQREADAIAEQAQALGYVPVVAQAQQLQAHAANRQGQWDRAVELLEHANLGAQSVGDDMLAAQTATSLAFIVGDRLGRVDEGLEWARHARAALDRMPGTVHVVEIDLARHTGAVYEHAGRLPEAREQFERALALSREIDPTDAQSQTAGILSSLGIVCYRQGEYDLALSHMQRAYGSIENAFGPEHERTVSFGSNVAAMYIALDRSDEAIPLLERCVDVWERVNGLEHPIAATALRNLGIAYEKHGELERALQAYERARDVFVRTAGTEHGEYGNVLNSLGILHRSRGEYDRAQEYLEQAQRVLGMAFGDDHAETANAVMNLGILNAKRGQHDQALALFGSSRAVFEAQLPPDHPQRIGVLRLQASSLIALDRVDEAISQLERALAVSRGGDRDRRLVAELEAELATARERAQRSASRP